jgi:hypothetical protein
VEYRLVEETGPDDRDGHEHRIATGPVVGMDSAAPCAP